MAGSAAAPGAKAGRALRAKEWQVVYVGPGVKCYTIKFASLTDPLKEGGEPAIAIYIDGDQEPTWPNHWPLESPPRYAERRFVCAGCCVGVK